MKAITVFGGALITFLKADHETELVKLTLNIAINFAIQALAHTLAGDDTLQSWLRDAMSIREFRPAFIFDGQRYLEKLHSVLAFCHFLSIFG